MNKILICLILSLGFSISCSAHDVLLTFDKSTSDTGASGQGYTIWRMNGNCPSSVTATAGFQQFNATPFTTNTFDDLTVTPGIFCYTATFTSAGNVSAPSNAITVTVQPNAPTNVTIGSTN